MNINHIPFLLEIYHCGSINKAAQNLYISQPQISRILGNIEKEIGFKIFFRTPAGVELTQEGRTFMDSIRVIYTEVKKIESIPSLYKEKEDLSIACIYSRFIFQMFLQFRTSFPMEGVRDSFLEDIYDKVIERVVSQEVRIGIISRVRSLPGALTAQLERYGLDVIEVYKSIPTLIYMSHNHPLAKEECLIPSLLEGQPMVYFHNSDLKFIEELLKGKRYGVDLLVSDRASLLEAIDSGKYISISNTGSEKVTQGQKYKYLPVEGLEGSSEICCIKPKRYDLSPREKAFLKFLSQSFQKNYFS